VTQEENKGKKKVLVSTIDTGLGHIFLKFIHVEGEEEEREEKGDV